MNRTEELLGQIKKDASLLEKCESGIGVDGSARQIFKLLEELCEQNKANMDYAKAKSEFGMTIMDEVKTAIRLDGMNHKTKKSKVEAKESIEKAVRCLNFDLTFIFSNK